MCDMVEVRVQNKPTVSMKSLSSLNTANSPITAEVNFTYDQYSYASMNNAPLTFTWTFDNKDLSGVLETRTTSTPFVSHSPQYSGDYRVSVIINDGTYSNSSILGLVDYTSSSSGGGNAN